MSTVRINEKIKEEITPILSDLGLSLSEAINIFLHQIKLNNGLPFEVKRKKVVELNDGYGSYICEYGHTHNYKKLNIDKVAEDSESTTYDTAQDMINTIINEE